MAQFFKRFGLGIAYVFLSPFILAYFLGWFLYTTVLLLVGLVKAVINYFKGKRFFPDFKEDIEAKQILDSAMPQETAAPETNNINNSQTTINQTFNTININPNDPNVNKETILNTIENMKQKNQITNNSEPQQISYDEVDAFQSDFDKGNKDA